MLYYCKQWGTVEGENAELSQLQCQAYSLNSIHWNELATLTFNSIHKSLLSKQFWRWFLLPWGFTTLEHNWLVHLRLKLIAFEILHCKHTVYAATIETVVCPATANGKILALS